MRGRPTVAGDLNVFFSLYNFSTREMTLLDLPNSLDIAERVIPEVFNLTILCRSSGVTFTCGGMSAESVRTTMAIVHFLPTEENVAR
jgi:hypothetical protein